MVRYHAAWILPIAEPPIRDGWLAVDEICFNDSDSARGNRDAD